MRKPESRRAVLAAGLAVMAAAAGGVAAAADTGSSSPAALRQAAEPGAEHDARAFGPASAPARPVFALRNGDQVSVQSRADGRCLSQTRDGAPAGETCAADGTLATGEGISVSDECGTAGGHLMEITGLAPDGTSEIGLRWSDGATTVTPVVEGAFRFDGTNPPAGGPYPVSVVWISDGTPTGSASLPVSGGRFCLPAE